MFEEHVTGLAFPEAARWHDGHLWFSDMHDERVFRVDGPGSVTEVAHVPGHPAGLGWLPDGRLLVVSMHDRKVLRLDPDGLVEHADLTHVATWHCNDMVVDARGRAYVGNFGDGTAPGTPLLPADLALVYPDGTVAVAASALEFPNGAAVVDGTFVIAETRAEPPRLTAFDVAPDGTLGNRRLFAEFGPESPDGLCVDAEGAVWFASWSTNEVIRVREGGEILDRRSTGDAGAYSCVLGGPDGRTLFVCVAATWMPEESRRTRTGRILSTPVDVPAP
ncbi:SMP-30/gluconolactonase/LRE family protein [Virgisporangium ochraceum]